MAERIYDSTLILEDGDDCEVCGSLDELGTFGLPGVVESTLATVCRPCFRSGRFKEWLVREMEKALEESPEYEKMPDGKWKHVER